MAFHNRLISHQNAICFHEVYFFSCCHAWPILKSFLDDLGSQYLITCVPPAGWMTRIAKFQLAHIQANLPDKWNGVLRTWALFPAITALFVKVHHWWFGCLCIQQGEEGPPSLEYIKAKDLFPQKELVKEDDSLQVSWTALPSTISLHSMSSEQWDASQVPTPRAARVCSAYTPWWKYAQFDCQDITESQLRRFAARR